MDVKHLRRVITLANHKREGCIGSASVCFLSQKPYPTERLANETYAEEMELYENRRTAVANLWLGQALPVHLVIHPAVHPASNHLLPQNPHPPCHDVTVPLMWSGGLAILHSHHFLSRRATRQPAHASLAVGTV